MHKLEWFINIPQAHPFVVEDISPRTAIQLSNLFAQDDLEDDRIETNAHDYRVFECGAWWTWYSEDGDDINEAERLIESGYYSDEEVEDLFGRQTYDKTMLAKVLKEYQSWKANNW